MALITVLVVAFGVYAAASLKQQLLPNLSFPAVTVVASYPGAAPEVVEEQVAVPIENAVEGLDGVETTTSTSTQGSVLVLLSFGFDTDIDAAQADVEQALSKTANLLPEDVDPQVIVGSTADQPTMVLAATSDGDQRKLAEGLESQVIPALQKVDGVNEVSLTGKRDQVLAVTSRPADLAKAGLTSQSIATALSGLGGGAAAAGSISSGDKQLSLAVGKTVTSARQVENLWLTPSAASGAAPTSGAVPSGSPAPSGSTAAAGSTGRPQPVQLKDVASVKLTDAPITSITRTDGKPSLGLSITMTHDGSSSSLSEDIRDQLPALQSSLGDNAKLTIISDNGPEVSKSVNGLLEEGLLGLAMAILVILIFLRSVRSTLVTAVSIPVSLLIALIALWAGDFTLNVLTLGGLTIAVGRVVDDSIVVLENIKRHLGYGEDRWHAITTAVREVASAITSSTLTTVAVFLPIALVSGMVGELFGSFALTVSVAMLASLVVALTVVPALAYWFLKAPKDAAGESPDEYRAHIEKKERNGRLPRTYKPVITWSVRHPKSVIAVAVALVAATVGMTTGLKTSFLGDPNQRSITVNQTLPAGTDLAATDAAATTIEKVIAGLDGVASYQTAVGSAGNFLGSSDSSNSVTHTINLAADADTKTVEDTLNDRFAQISDAGDLTIGSGGPGLGSSNIEVTVKAGDDTSLTAAAKQVQEAVTRVPEVTEVMSDLTESSPQISIVADGEAAARYGLSDTTIVSTLRQAVQGTTVAQVTLDGRQRDVVLHTDTTAPDSLAKVKALTLPTATGTVRLDQVATVTQIDGPVQQTRLDGERTNTITATPVGDDTGAASTAVQQALDKLTLPAGATYEFGGVTSQQNDAFNQLFLAIIAALALVFLILVAVFRSIRQTLILLASVPFAFVGAIAALLITDAPVGIAALIGILMLIGIVVTNAIVLMDLVNQYRDRGLSVADAVIEGGLRRLRPILMTALATIFALLPMALGITASGGFISQPLAVVVIGGLLSSTLLTLVLIPVLYTIVETRRENRRARKDRTAVRAEIPAPNAAEPMPVG